MGLLISASAAPHCGRGEGEDTNGMNVAMFINLYSVGSYDAGEFSSPELTLCADSYSVSVPPPCYHSGT